MVKILKGFTLIELMIAVAVVGILAGIAIPSYQDSIRKSRRADAKTALLGLANAMERHFTNNDSYLGAALEGADTGVPAIYGISEQTADFYNITISAATASTYTLQATPVEGGPQESDVCGTLTITHTGAKSPSTAGCW